MPARPDSINKSAAARDEILASIRRHLADSARVVGPTELLPALEIERSSVASTPAQRNGDESTARPLIEVFRRQLESVGAHCILIPYETGLTLAVQGVLAEQQAAGAPSRRIALSNAPLLRNL